MSKRLNLFILFIDTQRPFTSQVISKIYFLTFASYIEKVPETTINLALVLISAEGNKGWTVLVDEAEKMESGRRRLKLTRNTLKVRLDHFSWYTAIMEYLTGRMCMEMLLYMEPPSVRYASKVILRIYIIRKDQRQVTDVSSDGSRNVMGMGHELWDSKFCK